MVPSMHGRVLFLLVLPYVCLLVDGEREYVIVTQRYREERGLPGSPLNPYPHMITIKFNMAAGSVSMNLIQNYHIPWDVPVYLGSTTGVNIWQRKGGDKPAFAAYLDRQKSAALIAIEYVKRGRYLSVLHKFSGHFKYDGRVYEIHPADRANAFDPAIPSWMPNADANNATMHLITLVNMTEEYVKYDALEEMHPDLNDYTLSTRAKRALQEHSRKRREARSNGPKLYTIQIMLHIDFDLYERWYLGSSKPASPERVQDSISKIVMYYAGLINAVDLRFLKMVDKDMMMYVKLTGIHIAQSPGASPWTQAGNRGSGRGLLSAYSALNDLHTWIWQNKDRMKNWDVSIALTGDRLELLDGRRGHGLSGMKTICDGTSAAIVRDSGPLITPLTTTHHIGHILGAYHDIEDSVCRRIDAIMNLGANDINNFPVTFSSCSVREIKDVMLNLLSKESNCLTTLEEPTHGTGDVGHDNVLPGRNVHPDQQCRDRFGAGFSYCGGLHADERLCYELMCYDQSSKTCKSDPQYAAADGTSCGDRKWCRQGKCVYEYNAPAAPDRCVFGNYRGEMDGGESCDYLIVRRPWDCYREEVATRCCAACQAEYRNRRGCEYGDREAMCENIKVADCMNPHWAETCCETCGEWYTGVSGCEYGNFESWCPTVIRSGRDCYVHHAKCCQSCQQHKIELDGCEYGDHAPGCTNIGATQCYQDEHICCESCYKLRNDSNPGCPYGDREDWCSTALHKWECYDDAQRGACCSKCAQLATGPAGCEWGDRYDWCSPYSCSTAQGRRDCCETCTQQTSPRTTTRPPEDVLDEEDTKLHPDLAETCPTGDQADWCSNMPERDCYVSESVCCITCPRIKQQRNKPECPYGDHYYWCPSASSLTLCLIGDYKRRCCHTCSELLSDDEDEETEKVISTTVPTTTTVKTTTTSGSSPTKTTTDATKTTTTTIGVESTRAESTKMTESTTVQPRTTTTSSPVVTIPATTESDVEVYTGGKMTCKGGDQASWCKTLHAHRCYHDSDVCCATCSKFYTGLEGCEFGDKYDWCPRYVTDDQQCYEKKWQEDCCGTCARFYTGVTGCEYGDKQDMCTLNQCMTESGRAECCETCHGVTITFSTTAFGTPPPVNAIVTTTSAPAELGMYVDCEDKASWCRTLAPSKCYSDRNREDICCRKCRKMRKRNARPGCEFGDHFTWCRPEHCGSRREDCCETCNTDHPVT